MIFLPTPEEVRMYESANDVSRRVYRNDQCLATDKKVRSWVGFWDANPDDDILEHLKRAARDRKVTVTEDTDAWITQLYRLCGWRPW